MDCPFCWFLRDYIGQYVRIGVVCNCDTNDHIYVDGYIKRSSFCDNLIRLFSAPRGGDVIFTACCDNIFEVYLFGNTVASVDKDISKDDIIDVKTMIEQRQSLLEKAQKKLLGEATDNE